jgi:DNA-binding response OmpR family regulator
MRILICDDHDSIRGMIETLVSASGHEVVGVASGAKAVERALTEHFDVLLLDLMLPGLDGFDVCARLRSEDKTRAMPIFIISAMDDPATRERAKRIGATAFYGKPFNSMELLEDIGKLGPFKG